MKCLNHVMIFVVMIAASCLGSAEEVYQSKDKQGNAVFSDQPSSGAKVVDVEKPTIVHLEPGKPADKSVARETKGSINKQNNPAQPEVVYGGGYYEDDERDRLRREELERKQGRREHAEDRADTGQPAHREGVKRSAAPHGGRR